MAGLGEQDELWAILEDPLDPRGRHVRRAYRWNRGWALTD
jgi:hypothetical protein